MSEQTTILFFFQKINRYPSDESNNHPLHEKQSQINESYPMWRNKQETIASIQRSAFIRSVQKWWKK